MHTFAWIAAGTSLLSFGSSAMAQSSFMADVIGQSVAGYGSGRPDACYDGRWTPSAKSIAAGDARTDAMMAAYRQAASTSSDLNKLFTAEKRWQLDGHRQNIRAVEDPWIRKAARLERVAFIVGNEGFFYHAQWKAYAADGTYLGLYDGLMNIPGNRFKALDLYSPNTDSKPMSMTPFCQMPGDAEAWSQAKAEREAKKAAKRAAK